MARVLSPAVSTAIDLLLPGLEPALLRVEGALQEATAAREPFLQEVAGHLAAAGGKRLRPALVLATAGLYDPDSTEPTDEAVRGAVAVELVHLGSLYHDDVMDGAVKRRGVESVNHRWGNLVAVLAGDFLLARASEIAASLGTEIAGLLAATIARLCEGEVTQLRWAFDTNRPEQSYFEAIAGKTASLMSAAARIGALVGGAPPAEVEALTEYGHSLGMCFQVWDDVRDLVASEGVLGKPAGHDMVEGTYTLPVIRALAVEGLGRDLRALLGGPLEPPARDKARDLVVASGVIASCVRDAAAWAARAEEALRPLCAAGVARGDDRLEVLGKVGAHLVEELANG
jgi:heptaprenyl diphosphate synthase